MNRIQHPKTAIALSSILAILGICIGADTNQPLKTPEKPVSSTQGAVPRTNAIELESVKAAQAPKPRQSKPIAIILRKVWIIQVPGGQLVVAPERYLQDLTNLYSSTMIEKLALEEP